jgi:hypothetical protein
MQIRSCAELSSTVLISAFQQQAGQQACLIHDENSRDDSASARNIFDWRWRDPVLGISDQFGQMRAATNHIMNDQNRTGANASVLVCSQILAPLPPSAITSVPISAGCSRMPRGKTI